MDSDTTSSVSSFANKEQIKAEMLDIIVTLYHEEGIELSKEAKDFVLNRTEQLLGMYDVGATIEARKFKLEDGAWSDFYVPITAIDTIFDEFRSKLAMIFLQLISYDLTNFIAKK